MARTSLDSVLHYTRALVGPNEGVSEHELLERFLIAREEAAFAALVERHGPMVLGVCRRLLRDAHDAEDAFQATFLTLAHNAASVRKHESLASWLYGVACRVSWRARANAARRRACEHQAQAMRPTSDMEAAPADLAAVLAEELERLPAKYRSPIVLCYLQGQTNEEAARQLGWPVGTVKGRLSRARDLLRSRLTRRGLAPSAAVISTTLAENACARVPLHLAHVALRLALAPGSKEAASVSATAAALAEGVLRPTAWARLKHTLAAILLLALGGAGALVLGGVDPPPPRDGAVADDPAPAANRVAQPALDPHGDPLPAGVRARLGTVRFRHGAWIYGLAYSPDGKLLASGGGERAIWLWDADTGRRLRRLVGHKSYCQTVLFSPDGKTLASLGWEEPGIVLWDVATGKEVRRLAGHRKQTHAIAFSPDGKLLASVGLDGRTLLWDVDKGTHAGKLPDAGRHPCCVTFSPDGKIVAAGGHSHALILWERATGKEVRRLEPERDCAVLSAAFTRDGKQVALGCMNGTASLWDVGTGKMLRRWANHKGYVYTVAFSPDDKTLAVSTYRSLDIRRPPSLDLYDVSTGKEAVSLEANWGSMHGAAFAPNGKVLAAADGNAIRRWDVATGRELLPRGDHRGGVWGVAVSPDGKTAYSAGQDASVYAWDTATGKKIFTLRGHRSGPISVYLTADGKTLATAGNDSMVMLWDAVTGKALREWQVSNLRSFSLTPDGRTIVTGSDTLGLGYWDVATGKELRRAVRSGYYYDLNFSPDGRVVASSEYGGLRHVSSVCLRDTSNDRVLASVENLGRVSAVAFSPDGRWLASALDEKEQTRQVYLVRLHTVPDGKVVREFRGHKDGVSDVAFSPDGWTLASASRDGTIRLWEIASGQMRRVLEGHHGWVHTLAFSADGRTLVSGGEDTNVLVWDMTDRVIAHRKGKPPTRADLEQRWADLADPSAEKAYEAICYLMAFPREAVPILREGVLNLQPTAKKIAQWIADLDDDNFAVRERGSRELKTLGRLVEPDLREALASTKSLEVRRRLERLLKGISGAKDQDNDSQGLRLMRALEVLERAGTPAARQTLEAVAESKTKSALTSAAAAALKRLQRRPAAR